MKSSILQLKAEPASLTLVCCLAVLCSLAYAPALNNGFIADDYITLERVSEWKQDFLYIFRIVPECFRMTTHLAFGLFMWAFGYHSPLYYAFTILLHLSNCLLVWRLTGLLSESKSRKTGALAALLFAVFQNPQEAIMWLSGMNELFLTFFVLTALLFWHRKQFLWSAVCYFLALFSKESAVVLLLLVPLTEWWLTRAFGLRRQYIYLVVPTLLFGAVFMLTLPNNQMVHAGFYSLGFSTIRVLITSLHRLIFPWLYLGAAALYLTERRLPPTSITKGVVWMAVSLLPYIFLGYQNHVPSRQEYLASFGLAWSLSETLAVISSAAWQRSFLAVFMAANVGYLWTVKDAQFVRRAAPTTRLIEQLRNRPPQQILIRNFPLNPWIAKDTAWLVSGWRPEMILAEPTQQTCPTCLSLSWNPKSERYDASP